MKEYKECPILDITSSSSLSLQWNNEKLTWITPKRSLRHDGLMKPLSSTSRNYHCLLDIKFK